MKIGLYFKMVETANAAGSSNCDCRDHHQEEPDMEEFCRLLACWSRSKAQSTNVLSISMARA